MQVLRRRLISREQEPHGGRARSAKRAESQRGPRSARQRPCGYELRTRATMFYLRTGSVTRRRRSSRPEPRPSSPRSVSAQHTIVNSPVPTAGMPACVFVGVGVERDGRVWFSVWQG